MKLRVFYIDSFASGALGGGQTAVVLNDEALTDDVCLKIAQEINLSETAFVRRVEKEGTWTSGDYFELRWWTRIREAHLCGHGTLSAAHVLFTACGNRSELITFRTRLAGELRVRRLPNGHRQLGLPRRPLERIHLSECRPSEEHRNHEHLDFWTSVTLAAIGPNEAVLCAALADPVGIPTLILELSPRPREAFEGIALDPAAVLALDPQAHRVRMVAVTMRGEGEWDFYDRVLSPWYGSAEDSATGTAHVYLAEFWAAKLGRTRLLGRQCSPRGGEFGLAVDGDEVLLSGPCHTLLSGTISMQ